MARRFLCPYLGSEVELTEERERHIAVHHPEVGRTPFDLLAATLAIPDEVRCDAYYPGTRLFSRFFPHLLRGKHLIVAVVSSSKPTARHWIVTAFASRKPPKGDLEWKR